MLAQINSLQDQLHQRGIFYDMSHITNDDNRPIKYRQQHTRGNTKNQKKKIKQQHLHVLRNSVVYLESLLDNNSNIDNNNIYNASNKTNSNSNNNDKSEKEYDSSNSNNNDESEKEYDSNSVGSISDDDDGTYYFDS